MTDPTPLPPRPNPPGDHHVHKIRMSVGRKRYEVGVRVEVRELTRGPAEVIEMPERPPEEG